MTPRTTRKAITSFRALALIVSFISGSVLFLSMKANRIANDVWTQLGILPADGKVNMKFSLLNGRLQYFGAKNAKNIASGNRADVVKQLVAEAKKYVASADFKKAYADYRVKLRPKKPEAAPTVSVETIKAEEKTRLENNLKTAEANLNSPNPKIKNGAPTAIENIKKQIAALEDPNNPTIKRRLDDANRWAGAADKEYNDKLQKIDAKYPEDSRLLIKKRLQEILDITADVDYAAELKEGWKPGLKVFVNPAYEKKPAEWKLAYRAGKPATDAVRAAAEEWLAELK